MKRNRLYIAWGLSLLVILYILYQMDWTQVWGTIKAIHVGWAAAALLFHYLTYLFRSFRFRMLIGSKLPIIKFFGVTQLYGMYLYLMPIKSGEVSFPLLLKEHHQVPLVQGTAVLLVARFLDLIIMAFLFPVLLFFQWENLSPSLRILIIFLCGIVIGLWIIMIWLLRKPEVLTPFFARLAGSKREIVVRFGGIFSRIYQEMKSIYLNKKLIHSFILSILIWLLVQNTLYSIIISLGYQVTIFQIYVVTLILIPITLIPIQGFANLGSHELSVVAAFSLFGVAYMDSLNIAIGSHILYILFSMLLGLSGFLIIKSIGTKKKPAENGRNSASVIPEELEE